MKGIGREKGGLYLFVSDADSISRGLIVTAEEKNIDVSLWHMRLAHASGGAIRKLLGADIKDYKSVVNKCGICPLAKHTRLSFPSSSTSKTTAVFQLLHLDVWGPYHIPTFDG